MWLCHCHQRIHCRWALIVTDGGQRSKMLFVNWIPAGAPRTEKMSYAMFANAVRAAFVGIHSNMQVCVL